MNTRIAAVASFLFAALMQVGASPSHAAPVSYSFSTGPTAFASSALPVSFSGLVGGASGTFFYDAAAHLAVTNADGSSSYFGFTPPNVNGQPPSLSALSATVGFQPPLAFSDPNGSTTVWNDTTGNSFFGATPNSDALILSFDPPAANGNTLPRNLSGFELAGWRIYSVRMLWIESLAMTNEFGPSNNGTPTADFLNSQALPGVLPAFSGRLWLEFQNTATPSLTSFVFFNNLQVHPAVAAIPEPESYAMLLAGLALMGMVARRRRWAA